MNPTFYVKRSLGPKTVARPADIRVSASETVYVKEPGVADWVLGRGQTLGVNRGIASVGTTSLYQALITPATAPGVPPLDDASKRIWAALWHSEGALEAINSYDTAFLSFGPMQQTVGQANVKGELQGALAYVKERVPEVFEQYFGQYGVDIVELESPPGMPAIGHLSLNGKTLRTAVEKAVLRDFIWAYRCVKAMADVAFRVPFLAHGFSRLALLTSLSEDFGGARLTLGHLFRSEVARALLLDVHINLPETARTLWSQAARAALKLGSGEPVDLGAIDDATELRMVQQVIALRNKSRMWSPGPRAAFILLSLAGLNDTLARGLGYRSVTDLKTRSGSRNAASYLYGFLGHTRTEPMPLLATGTDAPTPGG